MRAAMTLDLGAYSLKATRVREVFPLGSLINVKYRVLFILFNLFRYLLNKVLGFMSYTGTLI